MDDQMSKAKRKKILIAAGAAAALVLVIIGVVLLTKGSDKQEQRTGGGSLPPVSATGEIMNPWLMECQGDERVSMSSKPMDMADVSTVTPIGLTAGAHVTPIDHLYFFPKDMRNRDAAPVYAMADGYIVDVSKREVNVDSGTSRPAEYRIAIQHSCQTVSYFDLLTSLDESVLSQVPEIQTKSNVNNIRIPVKAGQEIGRVGAQSLDTAVYNFSMTLKGFISPERYEGEFWKIHTDDFFSYFNEENKAAMLAKSVRKSEPLGGKIDYDQPGKLIGNWFRDGATYSGDPSQSVSSDGKRGYWSTHLAVFYYVADPNLVILSFGEYGDGSPQSFGVKGNAPDPAKITKDSGIVAYELVQSPNYTPTGIQKGSQDVVGVALFQVMDGEKLKVETFPNKKRSQVTGFTSAAQMYDR